MKNWKKLKTPKIINEIKYWEKTIKKLKTHGYDPTNIFKLIDVLKKENKNELKNIDEYNQFIKERQTFYRLNKTIKKYKSNFDDIIHFSEDLKLQNPFDFYDETPTTLEDIKSANRNLLTILNENNLPINSKYNSEILIIKLMLENSYNFYDSEQRKAIFRNNDLEWPIALSNLKDVLHNRGVVYSPKIMKVIKENLKKYENRSDQSFDFDEALMFMESGWM